MVFESLNKSLEYLHASGDPAAQYYQARVSDTYAQVLQNLGFYSDALALFQESLKIKNGVRTMTLVRCPHAWKPGPLKFWYWKF